MPEVELCKTDMVNEEQHAGYKGPWDTNVFLLLSFLEDPRDYRFLNGTPPKEKKLSVLARVVAVIIHYSILFILYTFFACSWQHLDVYIPNN